MLYDSVSCARGEMENRIKEQQMGLFADRTSALELWANQFRVLLSGLAYMMLEGIRRTALKGTRLALIVKVVTISADVILSESETKLNRGQIRH